MRRPESVASQRILCVVGTRPEIIKMAPVIHELRRRPWARVSVLSTAQHRDLSVPLLRLFGIEPDYHLAVMTPGQSLHELTTRLLDGMPAVFREAAPKIVLAQGDTTTVMATALACFYSGIDFGHVEAGLRVYRDGGHDGVIAHGRVLNDATIERLVAQGLMQVLLEEHLLFDHLTAEGVANGSA